MKAKGCNTGCPDVETIDTGIDCDGNFYSADCVVLNENVYFNIPNTGTKLSDFVGILAQKFQQVFTLLGRKIDWTSLPVYANDAAAGAGGLTQNRPYKTPTGEVRVKL